MYLIINDGLCSGGGGNFILSTSFLGHTQVVGGCAPMCENGYGVFNSIQPDTYVHFIVVVDEYYVYFKVG